MTDPVKTLLVGLGGYGGTYIRQLMLDRESKNPHCDFIAGVDPAPDRCHFFDELQDIDLPIYTDLDSALAHHQPELIIVSTPIHTHLPLTQCALASGASVLLEKPLCPTLEEADAMLAAEEAAAGFVAVGFQVRYAASTQMLLRDMQAGLLGQLQSVKTLALRTRNHAYYARGAWAGAQYTASGAAVFDSPIMNACAHDLYFQLVVTSCFDDNEAILRDAYVARAQNIENFDTVVAQYDIGKIKGMFVASHSVHDLESTVSHFTFSDAEISIDRKVGVIARFSDGRVKEYPGMNNAADKLFSCAAALRGGELPPCRIHDARKHIALIDQIQKLDIHDIDASLVQKNEELTWVDGLADQLRESYEQWQVPTVSSL